MGWLAAGMAVVSFIGSIWESKEKADQLDAQADLMNLQIAEIERRSVYDQDLMVEQGRLVEGDQEASAGKRNISHNSNAIKNLVADTRLKVAKEIAKTQIETEYEVKMKRITQQGMYDEADAIERAGFMNALLGATGSAVNIATSQSGRTEGKVASVSKPDLDNMFEGQADTPSFKTKTMNKIGVSAMVSRAPASGSIWDKIDNRLGTDSTGGAVWQ